MRIIKLDYSLKTVEERKAHVDAVLAEMDGPPSAAYLDILADYLVIPIERAERKERQIMTDNRMATINKRETSLEGLISQLENGEDGIYNLINESKSTILQPKISITKKDLEEIPDNVKVGLKIIPVSEVSQVIDIALKEKVKPLEVKCVCESVK